MGNKPEEDTINSKNFIIGALIGGIVGASTALLYAPKSGKQLRDDINQGAWQWKYRASDWKDLAYDKGMEVKNKAVNSASDLTKTVKHKLQDKQSKEDEALQAAAEVAEAIEQAADELEKRNN
ncbi:YtxH domain-containing protein [Lentibacillus sp. N15]|uniref:YtxH domain-containing protein n=1 Tax=Lentibacillus songyuanensis TaxID=3136161 RepID=UPI0031B9BB3D